MKKCVNKIIETREWAKEELKNLDSTVWIPESNFIFAMHPDYDAKELFEALKENDIYVRFWAVRELNSICVSLWEQEKRWKQCLHFLKKYMNK